MRQETLAMLRKVREMTKHQLAQDEKVSRARLARMSHPDYYKILEKEKRAKERERRRE